MQTKWYMVKHFVACFSIYFVVEFKVVIISWMNANTAVSTMPPPPPLPPLSSPPTSVECLVALASMETMLCIMCTYAGQPPPHGGDWSFQKFYMLLTTAEISWNYSIEHPLALGLCALYSPTNVTLFVGSAIGMHTTGNSYTTTVV